MLLFLLTDALADECAPSWAEAWPQLPRSGDTIPANARFRVVVGPSCGERLSGPEPLFRLSDQAGTVPFSILEGGSLAGDHQDIVLLTSRPLAPGPVRLEGKMPTGERELGPWTELAGFTATAAVDQAPPVPGGALHALAARTRGTIPLSPCEATEGPVVRTHLALSVPVAAGPLLYIIEQRGTESGWSLVRFGYPEDRGGSLDLAWEDPWDWGNEHLYRVRVVDAAGNETASEPVRLRTPPK